MPYNIILSDGITTLVTVPDYTIIGPTSNISSNSPLNLVGKNAVNYGQTYATNFVWLAENFASNVAPFAPLSGQLWYNIANTSLELYSSGNQWVTLATQAYTKGTLSTATNGYQKFPSGMIMQWGSFTSSSTPCTVTFPIPFTSSCYNVTATSQAYNSSVVNVVSISPTSFVVQLVPTPTITYSFYWQAIGF